MGRRVLLAAGAAVFFLTALPVSAVDLHYSSSKTYGAVKQQAIIEVPNDSSASLAQEFYTLFAAAKPYIKLVKPDMSFLDSQAFLIYNGAVSGWYLTVPPGNDSLTLLSSFASRSGRPVIAEIAPYDAQFITTLSKVPSVKVHTGNYLFWPRSDVKNVFSETPPPTIEAVSIWMKETDASDLFASAKLMFDTLFDASNDVAGGSGVKIGYPDGAALSLSGIQPGMDDAKNTAFRMAVAGGAAVTYVQSQGKNGKAPVRYVALGQYNAMSANARTIAARYAKFLSGQPNIIWPMAIDGNGDPYDNPFFSDSNSKPVMGVIGLIGGRQEGVLVNTSDKAVPVTLPENPGTSNAYSSLVGTFMFNPSFQMSPGETILFGAESSNTKSPPPPALQPTTAVPTNVPYVPSPTSRQAPSTIMLQPSSAAGHSPPLPTPKYFSMGFPQTMPQQGALPATNAWQPSLQAVRNTARLIIVRADPVLQGVGTLFTTVASYDTLLEKYLNATLAGLIAAVLHR